MAHRPSFLGGSLLAFLCRAGHRPDLLSLRQTQHRPPPSPLSWPAPWCLVMPIILVWASLMRTDVVGLAFSLAGFYLFSRERKILGVILLAARECSTRWTNLAAIAASISILVFQRRWKEAALWAAVSARRCAPSSCSDRMRSRMARCMAQLSLHTSSSLGKSWSWQQVHLLLSIVGREWPVYFVARRHRRDLVRAPPAAPTGRRLLPLRVGGLLHLRPHRVHLQLPHGTARRRGDRVRDSLGRMGKNRADRSEAAGAGATGGARAGGDARAPDGLYERVARGYAYHRDSALAGQPPGRGARG